MGKPMKGAAEVAATYRKLADDIERMGRGEFPSPEELAAAPVIEDYRAHWRSDPCMRGYIYGHPEIPDGDLTHTSVAVGYDFEAGWLRTRSRLYRLGKPHPSLPTTWR
jgi:hypothetical protein